MLVKLKSCFQSGSAVYSFETKTSPLALVTVSYFRINAATVALLVLVFYFSKLLTQSDAFMCINELSSTVHSDYMQTTSRKYTE